VVLFGMIGRALLTCNNLPCHASAASANSGAAAPGSAAPGGASSFDPSGYMSRDGMSGGVSVSDFDAARADRTHNSAQRVREWLSEPIKPLTRNLFSVKLDYFPVDGTRAKQGVKTAADGEFWGRLEKSLMLRADQRDKRENLAANFRAEAGNLRLDSIMMGPSPKAMINGKLVAEGDVVASFRVLKIEPRRIIVEREGIRLEILMK
jgi:hypothetical protein